MTNSEKKDKEEKSEKKDKSTKDGKEEKGEWKELKLIPEGVPLDNLPTGNYHSHVFFIHCLEHNKVLTTHRNHIRWMPFVEMPPKRSWKDGAILGFCKVLAAGDDAKLDSLKESPPYKTFKCMQILRVQMPQTQKFIIRCINYFQLKPKDANFKCCQATADHFDWFNLASVRAGRVPHLWGPELVACCKLIRDGAKLVISEFSLEEAYLYVPREPPRNVEEITLKSLRITQTDVERLYHDFVDHCFPSFYMTVDSYRVYMSKYKFERNEATLTKLFNAFNIARNGYLSFHELLLGLACMEPNMMHNAFRVAFLFRYYDHDNTGSLDEAKLKAMVTEMHEDAKPEEIEDKLVEVINAIGGSSVVGRYSVSQKDFLKAIGHLQLRGTSKLARLKKGSLFQEISIALASRFLKTLEGKVNLAHAQPSRRHKKVCPACIENKYSLSQHVVGVNIAGKCSTLKKLETHAAAETGPPSEKPASGKLALEGVSTSRQVDTGMTADEYSIECVFRPYSVANAFISLIRTFAKNKGTVDNPLGLLQKHKADFYKLLLQLHQELNVLLEAETKCQKVYSPTYIIGDIHGNIEDLLSMEKTLWPHMPAAVGSSFLFLGDYVDRGQWGLECALYIAAFKVLCPNKVTMLRGNHEVRSLQKHYSYLKECVLKYGEEYGLKVFELTNRIFDKLPVSALVDDAIFCAHGGIPHEAKTIEQIAAVKKILKEPEEESTIAWEILWSDPCGQQEFLDTCEVRNADPEQEKGFIFNTKRGTAYKFNEEGAMGFFRENMLSHIIRAHEVAPPGYVFNFINKCVTIFSSSHYCGNDNLCGFILAENQRMRVIVLDTNNNGSATD